MPTTTPNLSAKQSLTITLASLASSGTFISGRQSAQIDNSASLYDDIAIEAKITVGTTPTTATEIQLWVVGSFHTSLASANIAGMNGTDAAQSFVTEGVRDAAAVMVARADVDSATSDRTYWLRARSIAQFFGGNLPEYLQVYVTHNTVAALNATGGNHEVSYTGIKYDTA